MSLVIVFLNRLIDNYKIAWLFGALIGSLNNYLGSKYFSFKKWFYFTNKFFIEFTSLNKYREIEKLSSTTNNQEIIKFKYLKLNKVDIL